MPYGAGVNKQEKSDYGEHALLKIWLSHPRLTGRHQFRHVCVLHHSRLPLQPSPRVGLHADEIFCFRGINLFLNILSLHPMEDDIGSLADLGLLHFQKD